MSGIGDFFNMGDGVFILDGVTILELLPNYLFFGIDKSIYLRRRSAI